MTGGALAGQLLQLQLELRHRVRVEQLAELHLSQKRAKLRGVDGQRLGSSLREWGIALVDEVRDVVEEERRRERRWRPRIHGNDANRARTDPGEELDERGHVEDVLKAFAVRLEHDRECLVACRHREQVARALALLPQRGALARAASRQEQCARRVLAEVRREECRRWRAEIRLTRPATAHAELALHEVGDTVGIGKQEVDRRRLIGPGEADHDPVVGPEDVGLVVGALAHYRADRHRPGRVHLRAEMTEDAHAPVAHVVEIALDNDRLVVGHRARRGFLISEVLKKISGSALGQRVLGLQLGHRVVGRQRTHAPRERADRAPELEWSTGVLAVPERHSPRHAGCGRDEDAVGRDLFDAPARCAEEEYVTLFRLEHHLLVELANSPLSFFGAGEEDAIEAAVGNRAAVADRDDLRPFARAHHTGGPVPHHARAQLRELIRWVAARQHVEDALECAPRQLRERRRAADHALDVVDLPVVHRRHRDHLLRHDVERVARVAKRLDRPGLHALDDRGAREEVAAVLRDDHAGRGLVDAVAGAADALHPARDRRRRLDLDHKVDRAHVDPELEGARGHERGQPPRLEVVLDP